MARAAPCSVDAALAKNLPHRSREHEFTPPRYTCKGQVSLRRFRSENTGRRQERHALCRPEGHGFGRVHELRQNGAPAKTWKLPAPAGMPEAFAPLIPLRPVTPSAWNSQDSAGSGRARSSGLSSRCSETRLPSLIRPDGFGRMPLARKDRFWQQPKPVSDTI